MTTTELPKGELPSLSYQEGRLLMDEKARARGIPSSRTITAAYHVVGDFSVSAFDHALSTVVDRHEALRTSFPGATRQVVRDAVEVRSAVSELADARELPAIIDVEQRTQFAPEDCPRLRAKVLRASPGEHYVILVFDHLVVDAWSRGLVMTELSRAYAAALTGEHHGLQPVAYTYRDYVRDRRAVLDGPDRARLLDFWFHTLDGVGAIPVLSLSRVETAGPVGGAGVSRTIDADTADRLRTVAARSRATLFMVVLAAVQTTLAKLSGQPDQSIAANIYNRDTVGTERLVAPMAEMMIVRTDLTGADTFAEALKRVRSSSLDAQEHAELPYAELVKALNPGQYADPDAPIGVVFNMLYAEVGAHGLDLPGATCERVTVAAVGTRRLRSELVIGAEVSPTGIRLSGQYQTDRLTEQDITGVLDRIVEVLTAAGAS